MEQTNYLQVVHPIDPEANTMEGVVATTNTQYRDFVQEIQNSWDKSNWFAKAILKQKNESYRHAIKDYVDIFMMKNMARWIRIGTSKRYWNNIINAFKDNGAIDYRDLAYSFDYRLLQDIIPGVLKEIRERTCTDESFFNDIPLTEQYDKLERLAKECIAFEEDETDIDKKIEAARGTDERKRLFEVKREQYREKRKEFGLLLGDLLPTLRY